MEIGDVALSHPAAARKTQHKLALCLFSERLLVHLVKQLKTVGKRSRHSLWVVHCAHIDLIELSTLQVALHVRSRCVNKTAPAAVHSLGKILIGWPHQPISRMKIERRTMPPELFMSMCYPNNGGRIDLDIIQRLFTQTFKPPSLHDHFAHFSSLLFIHIGCG